MIRTPFRFRRRGVFLLILCVLVALGAASYSWYFEILPQSAISLLDDLDDPQHNQIVLLFSPHPDDETIAAGGYLAAAVDAGASVWVALVTDGNKHGLEQQRYSEFRIATGLLGIPPEHLIFLNEHDGQLRTRNRQSLEERFAAVVASIHPTVVIAPYPRDQHPDHAVTGQVVEALVRDHRLATSTLLYEYLVHYPRFPAPKHYVPGGYLLPPLRLITLDRVWRRFMLDPDIEQRKLAALRSYRTQLRTPLLDEILVGLIRQNELFALPTPQE